jgi:hypothetical protein
MTRLIEFFTNLAEELHERRLHAQVAKCDIELRDIKAWRAHCDVAEEIIKRKKAEAEHQLYLIRRKGVAHETSM